MTAEDVGERSGRVALAMFGAAWLLIAGLIAYVVRLQVPDPAELLVDVARRPAVWIAANVLLIVAPLTFAAIGPVLSARAGGGVAAALIRTLLVAAGVALAASGIFHGVFGAHLASHVDSGTPPDADLVRLAEVLHALGDTCWFTGVGALIAITAVVTRADFAAGRTLVPLIGASAVIANLAQFGWFVDHWFGVFAAPGTALQATWFMALAVGRFGRRAGRPSAARSVPPNPTGNGQPVAPGRPPGLH